MVIAVSRVSVFCVLGSLGAFTRRVKPTYAPRLALFQQPLGTLQQ